MRWAEPRRGAQVRRTPAASGGRGGAGRAGTRERCATAKPQHPARVQVRAGRLPDRAWRSRRSRSDLRRQTTRSLAARRRRVPPAVPWRRFLPCGPRRPHRCSGQRRRAPPDSPPAPGEPESPSRRAGGVASGEPGVGARACAGVFVGRGRGRPGGGCGCGDVVPVVVVVVVVPAGATTTSSAIRWTVQNEHVGAGGGEAAAAFPVGLATFRNARANRFRGPRQEFEARVPAWWRRS